jgi:2-methylisocitrate lyase-like PEP mutase family enzyme
MRPRVPGVLRSRLVNDALIERVAKTVTLPVILMVTEGLSPNDELADLSVARISYGPIPYIRDGRALWASKGDVIQDMARKDLAFEQAPRLVATLARRLAELSRQQF